MVAVNVWSAASASDVAQTVEHLVATSGQTLFTLADITFTVGGNLQVFVNGVKQIIGASEAYTEPSSTTVLFTSGLDLNDDVQFIDYA